MSLSTADHQSGIPRGPTTACAASRAVAPGVMRTRCAASRCAASSIRPSATMTLGSASPEASEPTLFFATIGSRNLDEERHGHIPSGNVLSRGVIAAARPCLWQKSWPTGTRTPRNAGDEALLLSKRDVGALLSVSYRTIENLIKRGDLVQIKLGVKGTTRITRRSLIQLLRAGYSQAGTFGGTKNKA